MALSRDMGKDWLVLVYKLPAEPSRYRVYFWRNLREIGAVYLQNSVCILPDSPEHRDRLGELSAKIQECGGEWVLFSARTTDTALDEKILSKFNCERDAEYEEIIEQCHAFLEEISNETEKQNFSYAELEENESNFERLTRWLGKVEKRDFFDAPMRPQAQREVARCQEALERFAARVYQQVGDFKHG